MGIKGLAKVIGDHAPKSIRETEIKAYFGRKVALDASMALYQFLTAVRMQDGLQLTSTDGEATRTIRMLENGIKPVYVFDGEAPHLKSAELGKRSVRKAEAESMAEKSLEEGDTQAYNKFSRRAVKVTGKHVEECQELLEAMGIPYITAPGEAEAQCAALAKAGKVFAVGSEDMDTLTFGSPVLLRRLTTPESKKLPILEITLDKVLEGLSLTSSQFVDLCILLGCDYSPTIRGIGPHKALTLMKERGSIENIIEKLDKKYVVPETFPYETVRKLFKDPLVKDANGIELEWNKPNESKLVDLLITRKNFSEDRIRNAIKRLEALSSGSTQRKKEYVERFACSNLNKTFEESEILPPQTSPRKTQRI